LREQLGSWWNLCLNVEDPRLHIFSIKYGDGIHDAIGEGFGSHDCCISQGINAYFGPRRSERPRPSPDHGVGEAKYSTDYYHRHYSYPEKLVPLMKKVENASRLVIHAFTWVNRCI